EFSCVILTAVYIPPHVNTDAAVAQLADIVTKTENFNHDSFVVVAGDFNRANLKREMPKYVQQFAYRQTRSVEDVVSFGLFYALHHLENPNTYARILFVDYSSAFNTIIPAKLFEKIEKIGVPHVMCLWILDFLLKRPQVVK
ncbi:hypothetical protein BaRGS_00030423, partial [Batillaria attramentaria]